MSVFSNESTAILKVLNNAQAIIEFTMNGIIPTANESFSNVMDHMHHG